MMGSTHYISHLDFVDMERTPSHKRREKHHKAVHRHHLAQAKTRRFDRSITKHAQVLALLLLICASVYIVVRRVGFLSL